MTARDNEEIDNVVKHIRSDTGCSMEIDITRGTDTRDQEKFKIKAKGETFDEMREMLEQQKDLVLYDGLGDEIREFQN